MLSSCYGYLLSLCFVVTTTALNTTALNGTSNPVVALKNGSYVGTHDSAFNQDFFLGIPYAQVRASFSIQHVIRTDRCSHQLVTSASEFPKA